MRKKNGLRTAIRQVKSKVPEYRGKWTASLVERYDGVDIVEGRINAEGVIREEFSPDQLFDTREEAEEALALYQLVSSAR